MPREDHKNMKKIQCWIPLTTWEKIESLGYKSPTIAVTKALESLLENQTRAPKIPELLNKIEEQKAITNDLSIKVHILYSELHITDKKIEELNGYVDKQLVNIQNLILENSSSNIKLLTEAHAEKEAKKAWWKLWCMGVTLVILQEIENTFDFFGSVLILL